MFAARACSWCEPAQCFHEPVGCALRVMRCGGSDTQSYNVIRTLRLVLLALVAVLEAVIPVEAVPHGLPGGKTNFVVSTGYLKDGSAHDNWVRLGSYVFNPVTGSVTARMHRWNQKHPVRREGAGVTPDTGCAPVGKWDSPGRRRCPVMTAGGFPGEPNDVRTGSYTLRAAEQGVTGDDVVSITWDTNRAPEQWTVVSGEGLARLEFRSRGGATTGYGYGSNAPLDRGQSMSSVFEHPAFPALKLDGHGWSKDEANQFPAGQTFHHRRFSPCTDTTRCMTLAEESSGKACSASSGCPRYGDGGSEKGKTDNTIQYYLARVGIQDRRDTLWHWCTCLAMEHKQLCHQHNSHVKPLLQVLDDTGTFRGWVGVEASFYPGAEPEHGPRWHDMLAVFRMADFR
ncbi:hypothetical protein ACIRU3_36875 [Streptomyces sp. NPDC101151]|uniref:hypothetical protein n=1 Tax=Streptomyces sp. NPDC101151 TaxID=3366115 RepID=UPI003800A6BF